MAIRLIATDLDGTLLTSRRAISPRTREALAAASDAGLMIVPISGRQPLSIARLVTAALREGPVIGSNGAVGVHLGTGEVYFEEVLTVEAQVEFVARLRDRVPGVRCVSIRDAGNTFVPEHGYVRLMSAGDHDRSVDDLPEFPLAEVLGTPSLKLVVRHESVPEEHLLAAALDLGVPGCHPTTSGAPFLEVSAHGVTKASGLARLCARLGVRREEVIAFGDHRNDVEMLRWAGHGVAMGNARPETRQAADEVTASHDDDGLALVVERLLG